MRRQSGIPKNAPGAVGQTAGSLFDLSGASQAKVQAPLGPVSTQGAKRSPLNAQKSQEKAPTHSKSDGTSQIGGGTTSLKPKTIKRVADTDWYLVTSVSDSKYFYNRKTGETASRLPQSVADHVGRIVAAAENEAVSRQPAQLSNLSASKSDEALASEKNKSTSPASPSSSSSATTKSDAVPLPDTSLLRQHTRSGKTADTTKKPQGVGSSANASPPEPQHIKPENVRLLVTNPAVSLRKSKLPVSDEVDMAGMKRFEFTFEEKATRYAELKQQYLDSTHDGTVLELSEEELDEIMQEEANHVLESESSEYDPETDIPDYESKIRSSAGADAAADAAAVPHKSSPLDNLEETNRGLLEMGDSMVARGEAKRLITTVRASIDRLEKKFDNGTPLNLREQAVYINGLLMLGKVYNHLRQWGDATRCLERAQLVNPSHPSTHLLSAYNLLSSHEYAEAVRAMKRGLDEDASHIPTLLLLAQTYLDINELVTAEDVLQDILYINPKHYLALVMLARVIAIMGDAHESAEYLKKAILVSDSRPEAYVQEARMWLEFEKVDEGFAALGRALEVDKNYGPAFSLLGRAFLVQNMKEDAEKAYKAALSTDEHMVEALLGLSVIAYGDSEWATMLRHASLAVTVDPGALDGWFNKGRAELELKQWQSAINSFEKCLELDRHSEDAYLFLGNALHGAGRTAESVTMMDKILELNPDSVKARVNKGFALQALGKASEALPLFEDAIVLDPTDQEAKFGKVSALFALGERDKAAEYYSTFKEESSEGAFDAAMQIGDKTKAAEQKASQSESYGGAAQVAEDAEEASFNQDLARATMETDKAMSFQPTLEELQNFSEDDIRKAMDEPSAPPMSPEDVMKDFSSELERINETLEKLGLAKLSADPSQNLDESQVIDPSAVPEDALKEYQQILERLQNDAKNQPLPDPKSQSEWELASSIGLTPDILQRLKDVAPETTDSSFKEEMSKIREEAKLIEKTARRASKARSMAEAFGRKKSL